MLLRLIKKTTIFEHKYFLTIFTANTHKIRTKR